MGYRPSNQTHSPLDRVIELSPPVLAESLQRLREQPAVPAAEQRKAIDTYCKRLAFSVEEFPSLDVTTALRVADQCRRLLDWAEGQEDSAARECVQVAVQYFLDEDDEEHDLQSPIGFDDDATVVALVAEAVGRGDLL